MQIEDMMVWREGKREAPWTLSAARIIPDRRPRFCVQILHGFSERKERWYPLMEFIAHCGGLALIHDLRGHGGSVPADDVKKPEDALADFGYDYEILFDDIDAVYYTCADLFAEAAREQDAVGPGFALPTGKNGAGTPLPGNGEGNRLIPRFLLGQSMGALMAAQYAARRSGEIDGLILSGIPKRERFVSARLFGLSFLSLFGGDARVPRVLNRRAFTRFNRGFSPEPDSDGTFLWLANDPSVRRAFAADPLCSRPHPLGDFRNLLRLVRDVWRPSDWDRPADIPVLFMAGENDPVAGGDERILWNERFFRDMGFSRVEARMYRGMRHEIFMDEGRQSVFADTARFALTYLPGKREELR